MKQNIAPIIDRIRKLARLSANDSDAAKTLDKYLNGFGLETLRRVEAVMYSGRGDGSAVELRELLAQSHPSKEDIIRAIMEKRSNFDLYFDKGFDRAKADGIDLDSF